MKSLSEKINDSIITLFETSNSDRLKLRGLIIQYLNSDLFEDDRDELFDRIDDVIDWCIEDYGSEKKALKSMSVQDFAEIVDASL